MPGTRPLSSYNQSGTQNFLQDLVGLWKAAGGRTSLGGGTMSVPFIGGPSPELVAARTGVALGPLVQRAAVYKQYVDALSHAQLGHAPSELNGPFGALDEVLARPMRGGTARPAGVLETQASKVNRDAVLALIKRGSVTQTPKQALLARGAAASGAQAAEAKQAIIDALFHKMGIGGFPQSELTTLNRLIGGGGAGRTYLDDRVAENGYDAQAVIANLLRNVRR